MQVPIYSATFSSAFHPAILRYLYIDSSIPSSHDFVIDLIVLGLLILNAGLDDQGLVSHLSPAMSGTWLGAGHTTPYEDPGPYNHALRYLLSNDRSPTDMALSVEPFSARDVKNEYELPWIVRGLMDDDKVKKLFARELKGLKESILDWQPTTRPLMEIKKRVNCLFLTRYQIAYSRTLTFIA